MTAAIKETQLKQFLTVILIMIVSSCNVEMPIEIRDVESRDFLIRQGEHYSSPKLVETLKEKTIMFKATFDKSAMYDLNDASLQTNINKLMGFSDCNAHHQENSARFGWAWQKNRLEIYAYCYVNSVRKTQLLGSVNIDEENIYEIIAGETEYRFSINGDLKTTIERTLTCKEGMNYMLYPYFGGSVPAPHDVLVKIKIVS